MPLRRTWTLCCLLIVFAACGTSGGETPIDSVQYDLFRSRPTACGATAPAPAVAMSFTQPEDLALPDDVSATLHTSCGDIVIALDAAAAPVTVNSFVFLAEHGYFDGTVSHRIVPGFVVQLGDPSATGTGFPGYRIPDELPPPGYRYTTGVVAMANGGPNTGGSQFFIVFTDILLDPDYTVFGKVAVGLEVLERIAAIPTSVNPSTLEPSLPLEALYIESVTIER